VEHDRPSIDDLLAGLTLAASLAAVEDDGTCWGDGGDLPTCGKPIVCLICNACERCCKTEGGPEKCWERKPKGLGPAPKPRWRS
jgi:hypothetical protein